MNRTFLPGLYFYILFFTVFGSYAQIQTPDSSDQGRRRFKKIAIGSAVAYSTGLVGLYQLWYKGYEQSSFRTFNDNQEWFQMDKVGHLYSVYTLTKLSTELYPEEFNRKKSIIYSASSALFFLTTIEVFDGFSAEWGFSWGDFAANTAGVALFAGQEIFFDKQIASIKYAYHNTNFRNQRPELFGNSTLQSAFKDYNGQTYWLSFNLNSISQNIKPNWLNLALGYGATSMISANTDITVFDEHYYNPERQFYLSLDIDWTRISTKNSYLKWILKVANCIKLPAPTIKLEKGDSPVFYGIYF